MTFGIIGSGSWATALAKILTDNNNPIYWWVRNNKSIEHIRLQGHNPQYLSSVFFDNSLLHLTTDVSVVIENSDCIIIAVPSAYVANSLSGLYKNIFAGKKIVSAIKGILPDQNLLLNDYLAEEFKFDITNYFAVLGPCHAEEVAAEKLSYLTFSGVNVMANHVIAEHFKTDYINIIENHDIYGVQFAAILKNIYALGAGIGHGLEYGDNFQSVLIANSADEMAGFLRKAGIKNIEVGTIEHLSSVIPSQGEVKKGQSTSVNKKDKIATTNYAASVYLGDLLVTCYSLYSRNRTFGTMIGKGYSVQAAQLEMSMVAEGYNASRCMHILNKKVQAQMPIAETIYNILWHQLDARKGFRSIEKELV